MTAYLPEPLAQSWRVSGSRTGESSVLLASVTAETTVYEPADPADGVVTLNESDIPTRSLFTVDLSFSPSLSTLGVAPESALEKAAPTAKSQFTDTLEDEALRVESTRETLEFEASNGSAGRWYVLDVGYPVELEDDEPIYLEAEAHTAVWPLDSTFGMAGGVLPLEGVDAETAATADELDVDPERDRETIAELIRTVDLGDEPADAA